MADLFQTAQILSLFVLPMLGVTTLLMSKLAVGPAARVAERRFLACLVLITILTVRTVIKTDDAWLMHMLTLSLMIVGSLSIPAQEPAVAV